ncbi:chloramphenicol phosphotransferase [Deinococcus metallilatus]|uniref:Chloramphenicol phosphotransferase n=1 Tax=Deinococcus metallilatus TaxID=1211322 RepID=A0AAJ5JYF0_9DEIO|nr:chloramphenicol phosphotransferase [Deinococcus metallilatus]RXJ10697.1 chloramphenicol phosphotransferase [Deinococcus metallilatus]TLK26668.1 chloramphenicol phosphotransferase [Deinococcus metallilatus]
MIVLNGGSSAGKSTLARQLQAQLCEAWLTLGTDTFLAALPPALQASDAGITFGEDGQIEVGAEFRRLDMAWSRGVAGLARAGAPVIVDEVFLGGGASQARWREALTGLRVLWVSVRCDPEEAARREQARGDRVPGMARHQATLVHQGVTSDLEVDLTHLSPAEGAAQIVRRVQGA